MLETPTLADVVAITNHALTMRAPAPPPAGASFGWDISLHRVPVDVAHQLLATRDDLPWYVQHQTDGSKVYALVRLDRRDLPKGEGELIFYTERVPIHRLADLPVPGRTL